VRANRAVLIERGAELSRQADKGAERREYRRVPYSELPASSLVRIPSRVPISLVDISAGGALLKTPFQLRPESRITLELKTSSQPLIVPFQLLRCYVAELKNGVRYHAAGAFERAITLPSPTNDGPGPGPGLADSLIEALEVFRRASQTTDLTSHGTHFNELLEWTVTALRRGEGVNVISTKIKTHLHRLFPSLTIGPISSYWSPETSTVVRFSDLGLGSNTRLTTTDRRFLKASAQLLSLLRTPSAFSQTETGKVLRVPEPNTYPQIVHNISEWMG
jgi:PilZ domain-containing protein